MTNFSKIIPIVDRAYVYDNSEEDRMPQLLFRTVDGVIHKRYVAVMPEWAQLLKI